MPASSGNRRTARTSRHLPLTPAVTTVRRGSHRPSAAVGVEAPQSTAPIPPTGLSLISSARGVRLSRNR